MLEEYTWANRSLADWSTPVLAIVDSSNSVAVFILNITLVQILYVH